MQKQNTNALLLRKKNTDTAPLHADAQAIALLPAALARKFVALPLHYDQSDNCLRVAVESSHNLPMLDALSSALACKPFLKIQVSSAAAIHDGIDQFYGITADLPEQLNLLVHNTGETTQEKPASVIELIDAVLRDAASRGASDIHFEPHAQAIELRYRIDGVLQKIFSLGACHWPAMLVRLKVIAGLNIAESRAPQDGRFRQSMLGRDIDFRVSSLPTLSGETVVIRLLDNSSRLLDLQELDLPQPTLDGIRNIVCKPAGLIVMAGPTGSGKSTTLYSVLNEIRGSSINIVTLEDPVEYNVSELRQCSLNPSVKLDFVSGIRAVLRQDPDVLLVGETRDNETAQMVARAALTGHLVMTTLHSQSVPGALARLQDLGLDLTVLSEPLLGILSQRLVRRLCEHCRQESEFPERYRKIATDHAKCYIATGCACCNHIGYHGRLAIVELYIPSSAMRDLLAGNSTAATIRKQWMADSHRSLLREGIDKVLQGLTSFSELARVIDLDPVKELL